MDLTKNPWIVDFYRVVNPAATPFTTGGSLPDGTTYYVITAIVNGVETVKSVEVSATITGGAGAGRVSLTWNAVSGAQSYRIYKGSSSGAQNIYFTSATNSLNHTTTTGSVSGTPPTAMVLTTDQRLVTGIRFVGGTVGNKATVIDSNGRTFCDLTNEIVNKDTESRLGVTASGLAVTLLDAGVLYIYL